MGYTLTARSVTDTNMAKLTNAEAIETPTGPNSLMPAHASTQAMRLHVKVMMPRGLVLNVRSTRT